MRCEKNHIVQLTLSPFPSAEWNLTLQYFEDLKLQHGM